MSKENGWFSLESSDDPPEDPIIPDYDPGYLDIAYDHYREAAKRELDLVREGNESDEDAAKRTHEEFSIRCNRCGSKAVVLFDDGEQGYYAGEGCWRWRLICRQCGKHINMT